MKYQNKNIRLVLFVSALFFMSSCSDDFLDKPPLGSFTDALFFTTEQDAVLATNGIYNALRIWRYHDGFPVIDVMTDDAIKGTNPTNGLATVEVFDKFTFDANHEMVASLYQTQYVAIRRSNLVIEKIPNIDMDVELQDRLLGEARFLRAMSYFHLVRIYGGVPIVTSTNPEFKLARSSKQEVYDQVIIPDLEFAAQALPSKSDYPSEDNGRATKDAAKALLARIYLFEGDFANVQKYTLEVINSGQYELETTFSKVFSTLGEYGDESVFEIGALPEAGFDNGGHQYGNTQGVRGTPDLGWGFNRPSIDLIEFFEAGDERLDATVAFLGEVIHGVLIHGDGATPDTTYDENGNVIEIEVYNQKVLMGPTNADVWGYNVRVIRYADVLLMAAEALNETGNPTDALQYLNQVRARARNGNPTVLPDITETDQAKLRSIIWRERRAELALEQLRFFDIIRTNRGAELLGEFGFMTGKHELFPIPQSEIDLSENTLLQNPGW